MPQPPRELDPELEQQVLDILFDETDDKDRRLDALCREHPESEAAIRQVVAMVDDAERALGTRRAAVEDTPRRLGEFEIRREVGRGGMGVVYEAFQPSLRRTVALKVLPAHMTLNEATVERFRREGAAAARIEHPGIVRIYATGEHEGHHYLAMEFVEGAPLSSLLGEARRAGPQVLDGSSFAGTIAKLAHRATQKEATTASQRPAARPRSAIETAVELAAQVAEALAHAHEAGIVHRDVKPSNILVRTDGSAVLTDFGLSRAADLPGLTISGEFAGTPYYASPEQARGQSSAIDARTDVFSLGATLYQMLTLELPFPGHSSHQVLERIQRDEPRDPSRRNQHLAPDLVAIVLKALEKDPAARYQTAAEFAADLRAFLEYRPVRARRASAWTRLRRWTRRKPLQATLAAVLAVGIPAVAVLATAWIANAPKIAAAEAQARAERIERHLTRAQLELGHGDVRAALAGFRAALAEDQDHPEALAGAAYTLLQAQRPEEARALLAGRAGVGAARALRRVRAWSLRRTGDEAQADAIERELGAPREPFELVLVAEQERYLGHSTADASGQRRALSYLKAALASTPRARPLIHYRLAQMAGELEDEETCRQIADAVRQLWPERIGSLQAAAMALHRIAPAEALAIADRALARRPDLAALHMVRGSALRWLERYDEAEAAYMQAARLEPEDATAYERLSDMHYFATRRYDDSLAAAEQALARDDFNQKIYWLKAHALRRLGRLEESLATWRRLTEVHPDYANAFNNLADVALQLQRPQVALEAAQQAVSLRPDYAIGHYTLAEAWIASGDYGKAAAAFARCTELQPLDYENWRAYLTLLLDESTPEPLREPAAALAAARRASDAFAGRDLRIQVLLARALLANDQRVEAEQILAPVRQRLAASDNPAARTLLQQVEAMLRD